MNIRPLQAPDAAAFQTLRLAALLDTPEAFASSHEEERHLTPEQVVARRFAGAPGEAILGAFDGGGLVGVVGLGREPFAKMAHKRHIWGMYVAPHVRGHGTARLLMLEALELARTMAGVAKVVLTVDAANVAAIALYESLGFVVFSREADAMRIGEQRRDDLMMSLRLDAPAA